MENAKNKSEKNQPKDIAEKERADSFMESMKVISEKSDY